MHAGTCTCGYQAVGSDELGDHLREMFTSDSDTAPDGQVHAEAARDNPSPPSTPPAICQCLCGFTAVDMAGLDDHLLSAFTPADGIGYDGHEHVPASRV